MSEQLLNPEEIAALFEEAAGDEHADLQASEVIRSRWLRTIDWTRPTKFTPDQENRLRRAHEGFCRNAMTRLAAEHRIELTLEVIDVSQHTWFNAHRLLPRETMCAILQAEPIGTQLILAVEQPLLLTSIELLLGGPPDHEPRERKLTEIDLVLVRRICDVLADALSGVWGEMAGVSFTCGDIEHQTELAQLLSSSEPTLTVRMEARTATAAAAVVLLIPHSAVAPVSASYSKRAEDDIEPDEDATAALEVSLGAVDVTLRAEAGSVRMQLSDVLELRPGDVLSLGTPADADVHLCTGDVVLHRARPGRSGRHRAVQVVAPADGGRTG